MRRANSSSLAAGYVCRSHAAHSRRSCSSPFGALSQAEGKVLIRVKKPSGETVYRTITKP